MPIYEYACPKCGEFEVTQRITESPLEKCPTCKSKVRKLISNTSFQLKGSGWYATDYAKKTTAKDGKDTGKDTGGSGGDAAKGADADSKSKDTAAKESASAAPTKPAKKDSTAKAA